LFRISNYKISTFLQCPLQYKLRYVDFLGARYKKNWPFLVMGHAVHRALADFYVLKDKGQRTGKKLKELLRENWKKEDRSVFSSREEERRWGLLALEMLEAFSKTGDLSVRPAHVEETVEVAVSDFLLSGRIDRIDKVAEGFFEVIDYKTGRSVPSQRELDTDLQMTIYATLAKHYFGFVPSRLSALYLRSGKKISTARTQEGIAQGIEQIRGIIADIKECGDFQARPGRLCQWCDFLEICEAGSEAVQAWVSPDAVEPDPATGRKEKRRKGDGESG
jgi:putative RecB family exonuclease